MDEMNHMYVRRHRNGRDVLDIFCFMSFFSGVMKDIIVSGVKAPCVMCLPVFYGA